MSKKIDKKGTQNDHSSNKNPQFAKELNQLAQEVTAQTSVGDTVINQSKNTASQGTVLSRMGGMPKHLLANGNLSDRDNRRKIINARFFHPSP